MTDRGPQCTASSATLSQHSVSASGSVSLLVSLSPPALGRLRAHPFARPHLSHHTSRQTRTYSHLRALHRHPCTPPIWLIPSAFDFLLCQTGVSDVSPSGSPDTSQFIRVLTFAISSLMENGNQSIPRTLAKRQMTAAMTTTTTRMMRLDRPVLAVHLRRVGPADQRVVTWEVLRAWVDEAEVG